MFAQARRSTCRGASSTGPVIGGIGGSVTPHCARRAVHAARFVCSASARCPSCSSASAFASANQKAAAALGCASAQSFKTADQSRSTHACATCTAAGSGTSSKCVVTLPLGASGGVRVPNCAFAPSTDAARRIAASPDGSFSLPARTCCSSARHPASSSGCDAIRPQVSETRSAVVSNFGSALCWRSIEREAS